jgi:hypothetical protein
MCADVPVLAAYGTHAVNTSVDQKKFIVVAEGSAVANVEALLAARVNVCGIL